MSADERVGSESRARLVADLALLGGRLALERFHRAQVAINRDERFVTAAGVPEFVDAWLRRHRLRGAGSTALHLCYVALGAVDFVHDDGASLADIAGAAPVLLEAGGVLTTDDGVPVFPITGAHAAGEPI